MPSLHEVIYLVKECRVILLNNKVAVVLFDDKKVQVPNSELIGNTAYVKYDNGVYSVISKEDFDKSIKQSKRSKLKAEGAENQSTNKGIVMDNEG